jgi:hypothetical protein
LRDKHSAFIAFVAIFCFVVAYILALMVIGGVFEQV